MKVEDSRAVVTGGASGIGRGMVEALARRGCRVLIADIDGERARAVADEIGPGITGTQCDVSDHAAVERIADEADTLFGGIDLVFANAGVSAGGPLLDADPKELDWVIGVNVRGVWNTVSVFGKQLRDGDRSGHICVTASEHSLGMQHPGIGFYSASKHAVLGMTDVFRAELPPTIGISALCPGLVRTELHLSKRHSPLPQESDETLAFAGALMAHGISPAEIGEAAVQGVERGDFLIVTHAIAFVAAQKRYDEIAAAFKAQAPWTADADRYDVNKLLASLMQEHAHP